MLAVTIDMDGPGEYAAIHGLPPPSCDPHLMYGGPLERFAELCNRARVPGTLFVVGRDLNRATGARLVPLMQRGFEMACHSMTHAYDLSQQDLPNVQADLRANIEVHNQVLGVAPRGFRGPGHHLSATLLDALESLGIAYSSSVFPSPPYYAAKALIMGFYRLRGRPSGAILGSPRMALSPRQPYRQHRQPYRPGKRNLVELPISVATLARVPVTGASFVLAPGPARSWLLRSLANQRHVVLNLHAMDLVDPVNDGLPPNLAARQPELRIPVINRMADLGDMIRGLASRHTPVTCTALATTVD